MLLERYVSFLFLPYHNWTLEELTDKCIDDLLFAKVVARQISKMASRKGTKDEAFILQKCNETISQVGVYIENSSTNAFRPCNKRWSHLN